MTGLADMVWLISTIRVQVVWSDERRGDGAISSRHGDDSLNEIERDQKPMEAPKGGHNVLQKLKQKTNGSSTKLQR